MNRITLMGVLAALMPALCVGQAIWDIKQGNHSAYKVDVAEGLDRATGVLVDVPGQPGAKGVQLSADAGQFHCGIVNLKRTFAPGRYKVRCTLFSANDNPAMVGLYTVHGGDRHEIIVYPRPCSRGQKQEVEAYFFATRPFSALGIKKMDKTPNPSQGVWEVIMTDLGEKEYPRLEAYRTLMNYPAPWGLRSPAMEGKLEKVHALSKTDLDLVTGFLPEMETWLDQRSQAADLCARADYLLRVVRLHHLSDLTSTANTLGKMIAVLHQMLADNRQKESDNLAINLELFLDEFQPAVDTSLGGIACPELGTNVFTWCKVWAEAGVDGAMEYSEPTPFQRGIMTLGEKIDLESSWTTSIYRSDRVTAIYSVLTPMTTVDVADGKFHFAFAKDKPNLAHTPDASRGWFAVQVGDKTLVFVMNRHPRSITSNPAFLEIVFPASAAVGFVRVPGNLPAKTLDAIGAIYQKLLLKQPVQCVEIQRGDRIEQIFEYKERPCDWAVKPMTLAPVPQLVMVSKRPASRLHVKFPSAISQGPDGWCYVDNTDRFSYEIPKYSRANTHGINIWVTESNADTYKELSKQGCQTIRLINGASFDRWDWKDLLPLQKRLTQNLQWAKDAGGLKVGVEVHGNWFPDGLGREKGFRDPAKLDEFIKRWKQIIAWCKPYEDIVGWYDLMNEPDICYERESVKPYAEFMRKAIKDIRPSAGKIPILVEACNCGNTVGFQFWEPLGDANVIAGYHDYWPHMFTHQRVVEPGDPAMPAVFFPSFMPMIEWTTPSWNNKSPNFYYWDQWKCDSLTYPAYKLMIEQGCTLDCGEYGVVGYAGETSRRSGVLWTRQALERFKRMGINHNIYGYTGGFTWNVPAFLEETVKFWKSSSGK